MFIVTSWYKLANAAPGTDWAIQMTWRGHDKEALARQAELASCNYRKQNYLTQVLIAEVTHEVVPPEAQIKIIPYKE